MPSLSVAPNVEPSLSPTVSQAPSLGPTTFPTVSTAPNAEPSVFPSQSMDPTITPSFQPSVIMAPTTDPSSPPSLSVSPSLEPSGMPSLSLSMAPTVKPSLSPTVSKSPSLKPSGVPSMSSFPSITQSSLPSIVPSESPSISISFSPTQLWTSTANVMASSVVAMSSDTLMLGDKNDDDAGSNAGCVYVFVQNGGDWSQQAKLTASASESNGNFGRSLAISGDSMIVGSDVEDAYIFAFAGGQWSEQARLIASDPTSNFGVSVAISGGIAIVGADVSNSAYIFAYTGASWVQEKKLEAFGGGFDFQFGCSVGVSGSKVVVGDWANFAPISGQGAVHVFAHNGTGWTEEAKLVAADPELSANLGWSVAIAGENIVAGSRLDNANGLTDAGSAYVFKWNGTEWSQNAKLIASDSTAGDKFGESVAISGDTAVVSAPQKNLGLPDNGAAYVFFYDGAAWIEVTKLVAISDNVLFGSTVSVSPSGDMVVAGGVSSTSIFSRSV
eukprot:scaffold168110_cov58-Attheya_sp.AAC.5